MRHLRWGVLLVILVLIAALLVRPEGSSAAPEKKPYGIDKRIPWTTSRVVGSPDPPAPYRLEKVFPRLSFYEPLELAPVPGSDRWVVAERKGKIFTFENDPAKARKHLLIDLKKTVYGVVMHPKFAENGYFYVTYILDPDKDQPEGSRLSRFRVGRRAGTTAAASASGRTATSTSPPATAAASPTASKPVRTCPTCSPRFYELTSTGPTRARTTACRRTIRSWE
jgi:hypothetical protein